MQWSILYCRAIFLNHAPLATYPHIRSVRCAGKLVRVKWDSGKAFYYRYGRDGGYDIIPAQVTTGVLDMGMLRAEDAAEHL